MNEMKRLRQNIQNERKRQGLSRNQLAKRANVSPFTLVDIELERGSRDIKLSTLIKLSKGLNISIDQLLK